MAKKRKERQAEVRKKKTRIGSGKYTKTRQPGPYGGNKGYKKAYRGQGK